MKKFLPFYIFLTCVNLLAVLCTNAQGIYQMWGTTPAGGTDNIGVLFSTKHDGSGYKVKKNFTMTNPGSGVSYNKPVVYNNKMYTVLTYGGLGSRGVIAEFNPATQTWTKKADLFSVGVAHCDGALTVYNGKLYGVSYNGGAHKGGAIIEYNPVNNALAVVYDFASNEVPGYFPQASLTVYNNKMYGVAHGGVNGAGVIFEFDPVTHAYSKKYDFNKLTSGEYPRAALTVFDGKLWGVTAYGGLNDGGTLFSYDPDNNTFAKKADLESADLTYSDSKLAVLNNKLYGTASSGGATGVLGGIFEYNPATNLLTNVYDFTFTGAHSGIEFFALNNKLYSSSFSGGTDDGGTIFSYDPATDIYQPVLNLKEHGLEHGAGSLTFYNNRLYGFALDGGDYRHGALFSIDPATAAFNKHVHLGGPELYSPTVAMVYYNHRFYGTTESGGANGYGGIYEYHPATGIFNMLAHFTEAQKIGPQQGGFIVYNNKFYGLTARIGYSSGTLYEFDPATNVLLTRHTFTNATGSQPAGTLSVYNGKLYGMCTYGSTNGNGNIFEFDPLTGIYTQKVILGPAFGGFPRGTMTLYNNKFYGTCYSGGTNTRGTIFEYNPAINSYIKKAEFDGSNGEGPWAGLTEYNGKFYGTTFFGGAKDSGVLFQYDPVNATITKKKDMDYVTGQWPMAHLTVLNNKIYGMTTVGGTSDEGTLFQFDPVTGTYTKKLDFDFVNGARPLTSQLVPIPALTAPGSPGSCTNTQTVNINAANANEWIPFTDAEGRAVAEINANGNILGNTAVRFFVNDGNIRQNVNGQFYLDRNITITSANPPATPVSIRLYVRKSEFESLKATAGSGVSVPSDLAIYKNEDFCSSTMNTPAVKLTSVKGDWATDYVYSTEVTSFSSFYFATGNAVVLPIHLLSFSGQKQGAINRLQWKASCTGGVNFTVERSGDGVQFSPIGVVMAPQGDCNQPFVFPDATPLTKGWYRLHMKEDNGATTYSSILFLDRSRSEASGITVVPNPASGSTAQLSITSEQAGQAFLRIFDMTGRVLQTKEVMLIKGTNTIPLDIRALSPGAYTVTLDNGQLKQTARFIKQ